VVAKVGERLAVNKQTAWEFDVERFNLRNLSELKVRIQYQFKISNRFAAVGNLSDGKDINRTLENIKKISKPRLKKV
jgi:hypothetical protein